jgi:hypothetical protein
MFPPEAPAFKIVSLSCTKALPAPEIIIINGSSNKCPIPTKSAFGDAQNSSSVSSRIPDGATLASRIAAQRAEEQAQRGQAAISVIAHRAANIIDLIRIGHIGAKGARSG